MKNIFCAAATLLLAFSASAYTEWNLQGETYRVDTISHFYVGPGTTQTSLKLTGPTVQRVFYTTTDLSDDNVNVKVVKGKDTTRGLETVSSMCDTRNGNGVQYICGVNADFFSMSTPTFPIGHALANGEPFYIVSTTSWQAFGLTDKKVPYLGLGKYSGTVEANGVSTQLTSVNSPRGTNYLTLYTPRFGATTETNTYGTEVSLQVLGGSLQPGKVTSYKVTSAPATAGNMAIPANGCVLSGHGTAATFVDNLKEGDIVKFSPQVWFDGEQVSGITQMVGGQPMIVSKGVVLDTQGAIDHLVNREPRTAVGFSGDKKKLVLLVVDGRQPGVSEGVTSRQLADIMIYTGCTEAMNFDGGGSTDLYHRTLDIVNTPSGGTQRAVADGVFVVSETPEDNTIAQIRFKDQAMLFPRYAYYKPVVMGYNKYGMLIDTDVQGFSLSCSPALGTVGSDNSVFCSGSGCNVLTATLGSLTATMPITIGGGEPVLRLESVIEDGYNGYTAEPFAVVNSIEYPLDPQAFVWSSDNTSIATVGASSGFIKGVQDGETVVHGRLGDYDRTINVKVEKPLAMYAPFEAPFDPSTWTVEMSGGTNISVTNYEAGLKVSFTGASSRSPYLLLKKAVRLWSVPDAIRLSVNLGPISATKMLISATTADGTSYNTTIDIPLQANTLNTVEIPISDIFGDAHRGKYPITINVIRFYLTGQVRGTQYEVLLPGIETVHKAFSGVEGVEADAVELSLYPNPVEAGETVTIPAAGGTARIFNVTGAWVKDVELLPMGDAALMNTTGLESGIYFVMVDRHSFRLVVK